MQSNEEVAVIRLATGPQKHINEYRRFALLVLASFGCIVCSFSYAWNLISGKMQKRYDLSQRDLSTIATVGLVFQFGVLPYAFLYDFLGPIPISIIATIYFPLGTLLLALCFMGKIQGSTVRLSVFNAMMACGCTMFDLTSCITVMLHFPTNRGPVTALTKTFTGVGSALVACLYAGYFNSKEDQYFFFLFALAIVVGALCITFLRLPPYHLTQFEERRLSVEEKERRVATKAQYLRQEAPMRRFMWGLFILIILIIYLPTQSALVSYLHWGTKPKLAFAIVVCILMFLYLLVMAPLPFLNSSHIPLIHPVHSTSERQLATSADDADVGAEAEGRDAAHYSSSSDQNAPYTAKPGEEVVVGEARRAWGEVEPVVEPVEEPVVEEQVGGASRAAAAATETEIDYIAPAYQGSFLHNLATPEVWALWWTSFVTTGVTFVIVFNAAFLFAALQDAPVDDSLRTMLTVLNGVGSAVGRLMMAYFEVWSQKRKAEDRVPITVSVFVSTGCVIVSCLLFLVLPARALPLPYVIAAIGNGFINGVILLVTRTIFAKDPAKHYHLCFTALVFSAVLFNRFLYGEWYTVQAEKQARADKLCYGKKCVLMPLLVMLGLSCSALLTDVLLNLRYRSYCMKALAERARLREEAAQAAG
ncbi:Protein Associated with Differentiation [Novymonas esmeraldas]|uniref:Protein Associated with Differentiation n=1 Tax=Novymonas esmeraldas TaxID=1808958 RepID=A0AAW0EJ81_9TRYP